MSKFFYSKQSDNKDLREEAFYCDRVQLWLFCFLVNSQLTTVYFIPQVEQI